MNRKPNSITGQWTVVTRQIDDKAIVDIRLANADGKVIVEEIGTYGQKAIREIHNLV